MMEGNDVHEGSYAGGAHSPIHHQRSWALGWEVRVEEDSTVVRRVCYTDWHRVELASSAIAEQVASLEQVGWREAVTAD